MMQIQNKVGSLTLQRNQAANRPASAPAAGGFAEILSSQVSAAATGHTKRTAAAPVTQKEATAAELYEQMKGTADVTRSSKIVKGVTWTDKTLATFAGKGAAIDMSKSVNWNATGEHTLTEVELAQLRETYDVENLSGQKFYDLMADLSDLNAISAEDIDGMFLKTAPPMGLYPSGTLDGPSFIEGDIVEAFGNELDAVSLMKEFMLSADYWLMNLSADKEKHRGYIDYLDARAGSMNKLRNLFSSIRG